MAESSVFTILADLGFDPVDIESEADYRRALKESIAKLSKTKPEDPTIGVLQDALRGLTEAKSKKEAAKSGGTSRAAKRRKPKKSVAEVKAEIDAKDKAIADRKAKKKKDANPSSTTSLSTFVSGFVTLIV